MFYVLEKCVEHQYIIQESASSNSGLGTIYTDIFGDVCSPRTNFGILPLEGQYLLLSLYYNFFIYGSYHPNLQID
jgi:hypothetical protein